MKTVQSAGRGDVRERYGRVGVGAGKRRSLASESWVSRPERGGHSPLRVGSLTQEELDPLFIIDISVPYSCLRDLVCFTLYALNVRPCCVQAGVEDRRRRRHRTPHYGIPECQTANHG